LVEVGLRFRFLREERRVNSISEREEKEGRKSGRRRGEERREREKRRKTNLLAHPANEEEFLRRFWICRRRNLEIMSRENRFLRLSSQLDGCNAFSGGSSDLDEAVVPH
jgi:hypothetical protein